MIMYLLCFLHRMALELALLLSVRVVYIERIACDDYDSW